ncbi:MAG: radical SAM protein [Planctomycetota bacterium]
MRGDEFFVELSKRPPFTKLHPRVAEFFKGYFAHEKVVRFGERSVVNTHFPPYPSPAFDTLVEGFQQIGDAGKQRLYSVTLAVTNRCMFNCWHCYNAGRNQVDLPLDKLAELADELRDRGAVMVTLTGGEPLLRDDLEEIARCFDERACLIVGTTGWGLTSERASRLREAGVFGVGISLDSADADEHDRLRRKPGAFRAALDGLSNAREAGLYPYVVAVATREFLQPERFMSFMRFAGEAGALEVHLLEPSATGNLAERADVMLSSEERQAIIDFQRLVARDDDLPILSSYTYLESPEAFGCGAGLTHLYIDGSGEVCPCQFVPLSFGNITHERLGDVLERMGAHFCRPRTGCLGRLFSKQVVGDELPTCAAESRRLCETHLPEKHALPRFFRVHREAYGEVGQTELKSAYDRVHDDYDEFWLTEAAKPIEDLVRELRCAGRERVFEAGCGTGYATALLAPLVRKVLAVDLSEGMLERARVRVAAGGLDNVRFRAADALEVLASEGPFDVVFTSWVLGYIPLKPFFAAASHALVPGGRLAFVVHKENSPREPLEIFAELVARDPTVLQKRVAFDFPRDPDHVREEVTLAGFEIARIWEGAAVFTYKSPADVLEHLLKSGAGTAFYDALDPQRRGVLTDDFLARLSARHEGASRYTISHEYVACIAQKPGKPTGV